MSGVKRKIIKRLVHLLDVIQVTKPHRFEDVPIVINNYNRLSMLRNLLQGLEERGYHNLWIIDNCSTYPPLLEWMEANKEHYHIVRLGDNIGHLSLFQTGLYKRFWHGYYVYTDSDLYIPDEVPANFVERLWAVMQRHPQLEKCGCALRIDDLPDMFAHKNKVLAWEQQFWLHKEKDSEEMYWGGVDTTFALYRPRIIPYLSNTVNCRIAGELTLQHQPWYVDSKQLSEEEIYYIEHCKTSTHWSGHR